MSYPLRIEKVKDHRSFVTTRTRNSELWLVNNSELEDRLLGYCAKYQDKYEVPIYALVYQGNHYHLCADFSQTCRAHFLRDFNSISARLIQAHAEEFPGGSVWGRRASVEALVTPEDIEEWFFYCALQPVKAGLTEFIEDYPGYNSFLDAINGREREYVVTDMAGYNDARRYKRNVDIRSYQTKYKLKFSRLPGYEHLSQDKYKTVMLQKLHKRRTAIVSERRAKGLGFVGRRLLRKVVPGSLPHFTKKSTRNSNRPLILTKSFEVKKHYLEWYFGVYFAFKSASLRFRSGIVDAVFPPGTYKPPVLAPP